MSAPGRPPAWSRLGLVVLAVVLTMTTWFSATAILPQLTARWQLDATGAAWMTNGVQLGFVLGALAMSVVSLPDLVPVRILMFSAALLAAIANLGLLGAPDALSATLLRVATGVGLAGVYPPALKLVAAWFVRGRGLAMGLVIAGLTLGSAAPHLVNALAGGVDWRLVVVVSSAATVLGGAIVLVVGREGPGAGARARFDPGQLGRVLADRGVGLANLGYFGHMWELYAFWGWLLALLAAAGAAGSERALSGLAFAVIAGGALGCVLGGLCGDRIGRTLTSGVALAVSGACAVAMSLAFDQPPLVLVIGFVWGIAVIADSAQFSAMTSELSAPERVGTALTFQLAVGFGLTMVSIWLVAWCAEAWGWRYAVLVLVPGPLVGVLAMAVLRRLPEARRIAQGRR